MLAALLGCLVLSSCTGGKADPDFIATSDCNLRVKGEVVFKYDPLTCQTAFNRRNCEFRVHTDNMSDFFIVRLSEMPSSENQILDGTAQWTTGDDLHNKKTSFSVLKMDGDRIWLWSAESSIAVVVQIL